MMPEGNLTTVVESNAFIPGFASQVTDHNFLLAGAKIMEGNILRKRFRLINPVRPVSVTLNQVQSSAG